jgi:hypothetical protein
MNDFRLKAMEDSANFLYANKFSRNFLYEVVTESFKAKEQLIQRLGLVEEDGFRVVIPVVDSETDDEFSMFVKDLCGVLTKRDGNRWTMVDKLFIQDFRKNKFKISKILMGDVELFKNMLLRTAGIKLDGMCDPDQDYNWEDSDEVTRDYQKRFFVWYGEQIKTGINIIVSANPIDILTASVNCSFTSCYSPAGASFNGTIASMLSPDALIAVTEDPKRPGYKLGRSWVYVNNDLIICARKYGGIVDSHHLHIRNYISRHMGGEWVHRPDVRISVDTVNFSGPGWLDNNFGDVLMRKGVSVGPALNRILISGAICLYCGRRYFDNGARGICGNCARSIPPGLQAE